MYCTIEDIEALLSSDFFKEHNLPDRSKLKIIAEQVAAQIDGILIKYGYTIPPTNPQLKSLLGAMNANGVAAIIASKDHPADVRPDNVFKENYNQGLQVLIDRHYIDYVGLNEEEDDRQW